MMSKHFLKLGLGILTVGIVLGGCSLSAASLSSEEVMQRFSDALSNLGSFHYDAELTLQGNLPSGLNTNFNNSRIKVVGDVMSANAVSPQFTLLAQIYADSSSGPLSITGQVIGLQNYTYFKLTDLLVPTLLPISVGADSRWYRIRHTQNGNNDPSILGLGGVSTVSPEQLEAIRELIASHSLFEVAEELPDETVAGQRSYHYIAKPKPDILKQLAEQLNRILQADNITTNFDSFEDYTVDLWINKRNFNLTKLTVSDNYTTDGDIIEFNFDLEMNRHNEPLTIIAPKISEDIDGLNWLQDAVLF